MDYTLEDLGIQIDLDELESVKNALSYFRELKELNVSTSQWQSDFYDAETKELLGFLNKRLRFLRENTNGFIFNEKLPVQFYHSLIYCYFLHPFIKMDEKNMENLVQLYRKIQDKLNSKNTTPQK